MSAVVRYLVQKRDSLLKGIDTKKEILEYSEGEVQELKESIETAWTEVDEINLAIEKFKALADVKEGEVV